MICHKIPVIMGLAHINMSVPQGTLDLAAEFYSGVLGLKAVPVPEEERAWFEMPTGQQIHISFADDATIASQATAPRHPCFQLPSLDALYDLQKLVNQHKTSGSKAGAMEIDKVGERDTAGFEYPTRFFARDYAGNRLEFSL